MACVFHGYFDLIVPRWHSNLYYMTHCSDDAVSGIALYAMILSKCRPTWNVLPGIYVEFQARVGADNIVTISKYILIGKKECIQVPKNC